MDFLLQEKQFCFDDPPKGVYSSPTNSGSPSFTKLYDNSISNTETATVLFCLRCTVILFCLGRTILLFALRKEKRKKNKKGIDMGSYFEER